MLSPDDIIKLSAEGRAWAQILTSSPALMALVSSFTAFVIGWHKQPPGYMRKDPPAPPSSGGSSS